MRRIARSMRMTSLHPCVTGATASRTGQSLAFDAGPRDPPREAFLDGTHGRVLGQQHGGVVLLDAQERALLPHRLRHQSTGPQRRHPLHRGTLQQPTPTSTRCSVSSTAWSRRTRVTKLLGAQLAGLRGGYVGISYCVSVRIDVDARIVRAMRVTHRADGYRPTCFRPISQSRSL